VNARNSRAAKETRRAQRAYNAALRCGHCSGRFRTGHKGPGLYHDPGCPVLSGAVDPAGNGRRAAALASEQLGVPIHDPSYAKAVAAAAVGTPEPHEPGPLSTPILGALGDRISAGNVEPCAQLVRAARRGAPALGAWVPWAPGRLLCPACAAALVQRTAGTPEDSMMCDGCHREPVLRPVKILAGDITVYLALCGPCLAADQAGGAA
jgi:hypothetical protein